MLKVALVGFGYWGPNLARVINSTDGVQLTSIVDINSERRFAAGREYPHVVVEESLSENILRECQIVAIATPPASHGDVASVALASGKHLFVEKPFTLSSSEAGRLLRLAADGELVVQVDYTYLYSAEIEFLKSLLARGELGVLNYVDSVRVNLGLVQLGANVIWDLAVHDFAIIDFLLDDPPVSVSARGALHHDLGILSAAFIVVKYKSGLVANLHSSWLSPVKVRRLMFSGTERTAIFDDVEADLKVKIYDSAVVKDEDQATMNRLLVSYRLGDIRIPRIERWEPLKREWELFLARINSQGDPSVAPVDPLRILRIAEAAELSISRSGQEVLLS